MAEMIAVGVEADISFRDAETLEIRRREMMDRENKISRAIHTFTPLSLDE